MGKSSRSRNKHRLEDRKHIKDTSCSRDSAEATTCDIPGYYYDKEKKRYFKILPNSQSSVSSFVTKETIQKNKDENQRLLDRNKATTSASTFPSSENKKATAKHLSFEPLLRVLSSMQCGQYTCQSLQRYTMGQSCEKLKPQPGWEDGKHATLASTNLSPGDILRLEVTADCDRALTVWSQKGIMLHWMQLVNFDTAKRKQSATSHGRHLEMSIHDPGEYVGSSMNKVTSLCWSPLSQSPDKTCALYTTVCPVGYSGSRVSIINLEASSALDAHMFSFDLGRHSVWSCAWNKHRSRFSVGCERQTHVIDIYSRCKWTYFTQNSDSLTQLFSESNPHILHIGTRSGCVLTIDMRAPNRCQKPAAKFTHKHPVVCLRSLRDGNYLLASDHSGLIRTWDFRFKKTVKRYTGLVNSHYQLPFYLDNSEKFVYATGSDGYCKIWDAKDGFLLKSIAPPLSVHSTENVPVSHLSETWGGRRVNFGLVTAMTNKFFLYT